jgi:hypothetical protein
MIFLPGTNCICSARLLSCHKITIHHLTHYQAHPHLNAILPYRPRQIHCKQVRNKMESTEHVIPP